MCEHKKMLPAVFDQTLGIICYDCGYELFWCWEDNHVPESVWNETCKQVFERNDEDWLDVVPCEYNRPDTCLCGELIPTIIDKENLE